MKSAHADSTSPLFKVKREKTPQKTRRVKRQRKVAKVRTLGLWEQNVSLWFGFVNAEELRCHASHSLVLQGSAGGAEWRDPD